MLKLLFLWFLMVLTAIPMGLSGFLLLQVLAGWRSRIKLAGNAAPATHPATVILMPAHNEAEGIATGVVPALAQLGPEDRLIVIADNCSDDTASIARELGAEVLERSDTTRRGKGYALDFGLKHIADSPPAVLMVVDADCVLHAGSLSVLANACIETGRPQQALDLMQQPEGVTSLKARVSEFAWLVKNQVRPLGSAALGLPCQLMGTGMAFPWACLQQVSIASSNIVEDMKLGVDLAMLGTPVQFCPTAMVTSEFPSSDVAASEQRKRWEHGHLGTIFGEVPRMLRSAWTKRDWRAAGLAIDLSVPPLAFFVIAQVLWFVLMVIYHEFSGEKETGAMALAGLLAFAMALVGAWYRWARHLIAGRELAMIPLYALLKIPMYIAFWTKRQTAWIRADRK